MTAEELRECPSVPEVLLPGYVSGHAYRWGGMN